MATESTQPLLESDAAANPLTLFTQWYRAAEDAGLPEPSAMALATANAIGSPSVRMVLLRGFDERGFVFHTNYRSRKADELAENPRASLLLYFATLARQIRIEGQVEKISPAESDAYFRTRPFGHQQGAWASPQSQVIADRSELERRLEAVMTQYPEGTLVPRPPHWGGYRVVPVSIEFWQGGENRLHDRLRYRRAGDAWILERLAP